MIKTTSSKTIIPVTALFVILLLCFSCSRKFGEGKVDLSKWHPVNYNVGEQPYAEWILNEDKLSVTQTVNADPSIFVSDLSLGKTSIRGTWYVNSNDDDDFIGFVFAYQDPGRYYLFDWKGGEQEGAKQGMAVKIVRIPYDGIETGNLDVNRPITNADLWLTGGNGDRVTLLHHESTVGWSYQKPYQFQLDFEPGTFRIIVTDGEQVIFDKELKDNTYRSGKFGFYNYSQGGVVYEGFETVEMDTGFNWFWILLLVIVIIIGFILERRYRFRKGKKK